MSNVTEERIDESLHPSRVVSPTPTEGGSDAADCPDAPDLTGAIRDLATGCAISLAEPVNCFASVSGPTFHVRGPTYDVDHKKVPSAPSGFRVANTEIVYATRAAIDVTDAGRSWVKLGGTWAARHPRHGARRLVFVIEIGHLKETPEGSTAALIMTLDEDPVVTASDPAYAACLEAALNPSLEVATEKDIDEWNGRWKLIPIISVGNFILKKIVNNTPALISRKLPTVYHDHAGDTREVIWSVAADAVARKCTSLAIGGASNLVLDFGLVLEGKVRAELPERVLAGIRLYKPAVTGLKCVDNE